MGDTAGQFKVALDILETQRESVLQQLTPKARWKLTHVFAATVPNAYEALAFAFREEEAAQILQPLAESIACLRHAIDEAERVPISSLPPEERPNLKLARMRQEDGSAAR